MNRRCSVSTTSLAAILLLALFCIPTTAGALAAANERDVFIHLPITDLEIVEGELPDWGPPSDWDPQFWTRVPHLYPYAVLDPEYDGEIYVRTGFADNWNQPFGNIGDAHVAIRFTGDAQKVSGRLFLTDDDYKALTMVRFSTGAAIDSTRADTVSFYRAKWAHYERLRSMDVPGGAWFRHQALEAKARLDELEAEVEQLTNQWGTQGASTIEDTYALLSGGRAVSENLQLDRALTVSDDTKAATVPVDSIEGITVHEYDWDALVQGLDPGTDALAAMIPHDQHAVFFPSFQAMVDLIDSAEMNGEFVLQTMQPSSEQAGVRERYEKQLALPLDALGRALGPQLIESVAVTGSDPYMRTGTDVAVLFEAKNVAGLRSAVGMRLAAAQSAGAQPVKGDIEGVSYFGVTTPDRSICSYMATLGATIIVTNSTTQLERLVRTHSDDIESLDELDEYTFFRDRYAIDDSDETALIVLSDATIRRWCGPRWRIATSRRTRAVAAMAELQATYLDELVAGTVTTGPVHVDRMFGFLGDVTLTPEGIESSVYGTLTFQAPIVELEIDSVTSEEAEQYERWRTNYERNWRNNFDPIAIRLTTTHSETKIDMTVMPLIAGSEYGELVQISRGAAIAPTAGDRHAGTLLHWVMAINKDSPMMQQMSTAARMFAPQVEVDLLAWLGQSVSIYIEDDPLWNEFAEAEDAEAFLEEHVPDLPIALYAEVSDGVRLTAFLAAARNYIESAAPDMTIWQTRKHNDRSYVAISPSEEAKSGSSWDNLTVYYAASGKSLIVTPHEQVMKRAIDRERARRAGEDDLANPSANTEPWLGTNVCMQAHRALLPIVESAFGEQMQVQMQSTCWGSLAILNEWRRRYPDADPVQLHQAIWQSRIVCPGDGTFRWNDEWQTMESTMYGHPGEPMMGTELPAALRDITFMNAGISFENDGLRARVEMQRDSTKN